MSTIISIVIYLMRVLIIWIVNLNKRYEFAESDSLKKFSKQNYENFNLLPDPTILIEPISGRILLYNQELENMIFNDEEFKDKTKLQYLNKMVDHTNYKELMEALKKLSSNKNSNSTKEFEMDLYITQKNKHKEKECYVCIWKTSWKGKDVNGIRFGNIPFRNSDSRCKNGYTFDNNTIKTMNNKFHIKKYKSIISALYNEIKMRNRQNEPKSLEGKNMNLDYENMCKSIYKEIGLLECLKTYMHNELMTDDFQNQTHCSTFSPKSLVLYATDL